MNILMLGNGFDINYKLLTKYINFLNVVNYLSTTTLIDVQSVGDILGDKRLQSLDNDIAESYKKYEAAYDSTLLEKGVIEKLSELPVNNHLFSFLLNSFNRDVGWIDFEKEISVIICAFQSFLMRERPVFDAVDDFKSKTDSYIISQFGFFHKPANSGSHSNRTRKVLDEYAIEYPQGSTNKKINKEKIIETLEKQMLELADGLRLYLKCFVENAVVEMCKLKCLQRLPALSDASKVVTFNYTDTYERLYSCNAVYHIHGSVKERIILGVNPDEADNVTSIDTSFLRFKKYFRRVVYHSDDEYLAWISRQKNKLSLVVMGHSLDITDKDVIMQMFEAAKDITVLYYNESAETSLVANLIKIYGKEKFDELRTEKRLRFLPQGASYTGFAEDRNAKELATIATAMSRPVII